MCFYKYAFQPIGANSTTNTAKGFSLSAVSATKKKTFNGGMHARNNFQRELQLITLVPLGQFKSIGKLRKLDAIGYYKISYVGFYQCCVTDFIKLMV